MDRVLSILFLAQLRRSSKSQNLGVACPFSQASRCCFWLPVFTSQTGLQVGRALCSGSSGAEKLGAHLFPGFNFLVSLNHPTRSGCSPHFAVSPPFSVFPPFSVSSIGRFPRISVVPQCFGPKGFLGFMGERVQLRMAYMRGPRGFERWEKPDAVSGVGEPTARGFRVFEAKGEDRSWVIGGVEVGWSVEVGWWSPEKLVCLEPNRRFGGGWVVSRFCPQEP